MPKLFTIPQIHVPKRISYNSIQYMSCIIQRVNFRDAMFPRHVESVKLYSISPSAHLSKKKPTLNCPVFVVMATCEIKVGGTLLTSAKLFIILLRWFGSDIRTLTKNSSIIGKQIQTRIFSQTDIFELIQPKAWDNPFGISMRNL